MNISPKRLQRRWSQKKRLLASGDSKCLAIVECCYTIEEHHLSLHCQNWRTLPLGINVLPNKGHNGGEKNQVCSISGAYVIVM